MQQLLRLLLALLAPAPAFAAIGSSGITNPDFRLVGAPATFPVRQPVVIDVSFTGIGGQALRLVPNAAGTIFDTRNVGNTASPFAVLDTGVTTISGAVAGMLSTTNTSTGLALVASNTGAPTGGVAASVQRTNAGTALQVGDNVTLTNFTVTAAGAGSFASTLGVTGLSTLTGGFNASAASTITDAAGVPLALTRTGADGNVLTIADDTTTNFIVSDDGDVTVNNSTDSTGTVEVNAAVNTGIIITNAGATTSAGTTYSGPIIAVRDAGGFFEAFSEQNAAGAVRGGLRFGTSSAEYGGMGGVNGVTSFFDDDNVVGVIDNTDASSDFTITVGGSTATLTGASGALAITATGTGGTITSTSPSTGTTAHIVNASGPSTTSLFEVQQSGTPRYLFAPATANSITFDADAATSITNPGSLSTVGFSSTAASTINVPGANTGLAITLSGATTNSGTTYTGPTLALRSSGSFVEMTAQPTGNLVLWQFGASSSAFGFLQWRTAAPAGLGLGSTDNVTYVANSAGAAALTITTSNPQTTLTLTSATATGANTGYSFALTNSPTTFASFGSVAVIPGIAPASVAGNGTAAIDLSFTLPAGGASSGTTGQTGGIGSDSTETLGTGGAVAGASGIGGKGGSKTVTAGAGGNGAATGGAGGDITLRANDAGTGGNADGGAVVIDAGAATGSGVAGTTTISANGVTRAVVAATGEVSLSYANTVAAAGTTIVASGVGATSTADDANTGIVTETFAPTFTVAANTLQAGAAVRVHAEGIVTSDAAAGNLTVLFVFGSGPTTLVTTAAQTLPNNLTNVRWTFDGYGTCRTTGASGTVMPGGTFTLWTAATTSQSWQLTTTTAVTYDTTASQAWGVRTTADDAGSVVTAQQIVFELLPQ